MRTIYGINYRVKGNFSYCSDCNSHEDYCLPLLDGQGLNVEQHDRTEVVVKIGYLQQEKSSNCYTHPEVYTVPDRSPAVESKGEQRAPLYRPLIFSPNGVVEGGERAASQSEVRIAIMFDRNPKTERPIPSVTRARGSQSYGREVPN